MPVPASGYPIRRSPGHSLLAANRGLSQLAHVLHRLLAPRHSLCALTSLFSCFMSFQPAPEGRQASLQIFAVFTKIAEQIFSHEIAIFLPCVQMSKTIGFLIRGRDGGFLERMVGQTGLEPVTPRLSSACSNQLSYRPFWISELKSRISNHRVGGGGNRIRTGDLLRAKQTLYQLSYTP